MRIVIRGGVARFVYDDGLHAALRDLGVVRIQRVSSVEFDHACQGWIADISIRGFNHVLFGPYEEREQALAAERAWIEEHGL